jgi:hypothetical protein
MSATSSARNLGWLAAACFVAGWFLPAAAEVPGWMAFRYAFSPVWPYASSAPQGGEDAVPQVLSALSNVVFVALVAELLAGTVKRPGLYLRIAIACFVLNLYWFVQMLRIGSGELLIGYYVWLAAFALLVIVGWMLVRAARRAPS